MSVKVLVLVWVVKVAGIRTVVTLTVVSYLAGYKQVSLRGRK